MRHYLFYDLHFENDEQADDGESIPNTVLDSRRAVGAWLRILLL